MMIALGIVVFFVIPSVVVANILRQLYLEYRRDRIPILLYHRLLSKTDVDNGRVRDDEMIWAPNR